MLDELDDLERVRAYRADVPAPDADTVAAARMLMMEAIAGERPAAATDARRRATDAPRRGSAATRSPARLRKLQRRRRFALAGGLAVAGVAVAGALGFSTASAPQSALAAQMSQLAKVAASQAWSGIPGPGQYIYTASQGLTESDTMGNGKECRVSQVEHRQIWIATDGSGAINDVRDQSKFTSPADQAVCASAFNITDPSSQNSSWNNRFPAGGLSLPTNDWKTLSTDPRTLLEQVHQRDGGPNTPAEWLVNIGDFMRESDVPPAIRAALYQATALIPGVKLLGQQTDPAHQTGLGVAFYASGEPRYELIFDQQNGRLLAEEYFDESGKVTDWSAYTEQRIADTLPNYPLEPANPPGSSGTTSSGTSPNTGAPAQATTTTAS